MHKATVAVTLAVLIPGVAGAVSLGGEAAAPPASSGQVILDECSNWRMSAWWSTPLVRKGTELKEDSGSGGLFAARTAPPPTDWAQPDFFDGHWSRWSLSRIRAKEYDYGFAPAWGAPGPTLGLLCLRGKFAVEDPAKVRNLSLMLAYRGGLVVYVNGQEVARASLPKEGKIQPDTLAEDYPPEVFVHSDAVFRGSQCIVAQFGHPAKYKDQLEKRIRRLENVTIDSRLLRKGVNVLAVEIHRAPYFGNGLAMEGLNHESVWSTAGLVSLSLRAEGGVAPNTSRPAGIQVWACGDMHRPSPLEYGNPLERAEPVSIVGGQNGAFNGRVMVSSDKPLSGVKAQMSDLAHKDGKNVIPAANVKLLYTIRDDRMTMHYRVPEDGFWDTLAEEPPARVDMVRGGGAAQAIVLKVRVAADAAPGDYAGTLTVSADGLPATDVRVNLKVIGWRLPDPKDFGTLNGIIQSPDSVALQYKVPAWSEEHWRLMEESFRLLGELGNKYVVVPIIARTNLGNEEGMIRWIKDGDGYKYDFTIFDRYLDLAQKYQSLDVVCLYAWEKYAGQYGFGSNPPDFPGGGLKVTLYDPATGKSEDLEGPKFSAPEEFKTFWAPAYREITARMAKRGLADATMLGISSECARTTKGAVVALHALMPNAKWVANPHADCRGGSMHRLIPIGYNTQYYMSLCPPPGAADARRGAVNGRYYGWQSTTGYYARSRGPTDPLSLWRASAEAALVHNCAGLGRIGADFWPVMGTDWKKGAEGGRKRSASINARYPESTWVQLNLDAGTEVILAPGPRGAMPTENFEQIRQGLQECQARILIEKALLAKKLDPELARKCQEVLDQRTWHIRSLGACGGAGTFTSLGVKTINIWYEGAGSAGLAERLYSTAAEVAARLGAN